MGEIVNYVFLWVMSFIMIIVGLCLFVFFRLMAESIHEWLHDNPYVTPKEFYRFIFLVAAGATFATLATYYL